MAGRQGFEPRYADPESAVLPLDDLPMVKDYCIIANQRGKATVALVKPWCIKTRRRAPAAVGGTRNGSSTPAGGSSYDRRPARNRRTAAIHSGTRLLRGGSARSAPHPPQVAIWNHRAGSRIPESWLPGTPRYTVIRQRKVPAKSDAPYPVFDHPRKNTALSQVQQSQQDSCRLLTILDCVTVLWRKVPADARGVTSRTLGRERTGAAACPLTSWLYIRPNNSRMTTIKTISPNPLLG